MPAGKNVVVVFGSPRKNSNTHILVEEVRRGLADYGAASEIFHLNDMNIKGCQACYYCKKKNVSKCALKDDMLKIHEAIRKTDGILVASPIYFGGVTAQTKIWVDRLFPFIDMNLRPLVASGKKASFIFTQNQPEPELFANYIDGFKMIIRIIGFEVKDSLLAYDLDKGYKPMVTENKEFMSKAYELGRNLLS